MLADEIDKQLSMIKLGVFASKSRSENVIKRFKETHDIYTGFYEDRYYLYLVNIDPHEKYAVLKRAKELVGDAFFVQKSDFKYGVYLLKDQKKKNKSQDPALCSALPKRKGAEYVDEKLKVDLIDVVLQTLSNSYKIKAARERMVQAKRDVDIAYAEYKPTLNATYTAGLKRREPGETREDLSMEEYADFTDQSATLTINQNLYAGGQSVATVKKMQKTYLTAKNDYRGLLETETMKAINAYYDIVFRREALFATQNNIEKLQTILEITQSKFDSGALSLGELSNVKASISNSQTQLSRVKSRYNNALEYYRYIVGKEFNETYPYQKDIAIALDDFEVVLDQAFEKNNKLKGFEYQIAAKRYNLEVLRAAFSPKVDLLLSAEKKEDEEFDRFDGNRFTARVNVSYNFYNGGRDTAEYLKAYASLQEDDYERESQAREMVWSLEKLYNSLLSLQESIKSIKNEVESSQTMVDSYWEGFLYGEQDLYTLLQAQKQLNTAELDLIDSEQNSIVDFFKVLEISGGLLEFFDVDMHQSTFLDMGHSSYNQRIRANTLDVNEQEASHLPFIAEETFLDTNETQTIKEQEQEQKQEQKEEVQQEKAQEPLKDMLSFGELFLLEDGARYTLVFEDFRDIYKALEFIDGADIEKESFMYKKLQDEKILIDVAYSVFDTYNDANATKILEKFNKIPQDKIRVQSLAEVQERLFEFNKLHLVDKKSIKPIVAAKEKPKAPFQTDAAFKRKFLEADKDFYTINVATYKSMEDAQRVIEANGYKKDAFVFTYGDKVPLVKFMYGVFESYEQANKALQKEKALKTHMPIIEKVHLKQNLYKRFNRL